LNQSKTDAFFSLLTAKTELSKLGMDGLSGEVSDIINRMRLPKGDRIARSLTNQIRSRCSYEVK
jgi:hypothetical protein